jgi:hypothetical protein
MKKILPFLLSLLLFCTSCGTFLQQNGYNNFNDPVVKTHEYRLLNHRQQDFMYIANLCDQNIPHANDYFSLDERQLKKNEIINQLADASLTDAQVYFLMISYLSHFQNAHTWLGPKILSINGIYPFYPFNQDSCWYLLNLGNTYNSTLIGKRIIAVNNIPVNEYEKKLFQFVCAENETDKRQSITSYWHRPFFHELISNQKADSIKLSFENDQHVWIKREDSNVKWHIQNSDIVQHPITQYRNRLYDYQIIDSLNLTYLQFHACFDAIELNEGIKTYLKPWLRPMAKLYLNYQTSKKKPSPKLAGYYDRERPVFHDYIRQMIEETNRKGISNLVIDLRNNRGGSQMLCLQLLYHLTDKEQLKDFDLYVNNNGFTRHHFKNDFQKYLANYRRLHHTDPPEDSLFLAGKVNCDQWLFDRITHPGSVYYIPTDRPLFKGKIVIIADHTTHSASALFTTLVQDNKIGQVIGTEQSNNPTGPTVMTPFKLPNSNWKGSIATHYMVRPDSTQSKMFVPDYRIQKSMQDFLDGKDPLFDKAVELLQPGHTAIR